MLVDIDYIESVKRRFAQINAENIKDLRWVKGGEEVSFSDEDLENFKFIGMNNTCIIDIFNHKPI